MKLTINSKVCLKIIFAFLTSVSLFLVSKETLWVKGDVEPPQFPSCTEKIFTQPGDKAHYTSGVHGIPGVGNLEGSDDVYSLSNDNFLQCFCPINGTTGIQSNWWRVGYLNLSETEYSTFLGSGWLKENGSGWNLVDDTYLIKNSNFSCVQPSPTPQPTETPTPTLTPVPTEIPTLTPAPTETPTPPPTSPQGPTSKCINLEVEPSEGTAPLTVKFTGSADDPSQQGKLKAWRFDFADFSGGQMQVVEQNDNVAYHRYELSGKYEAKLRVQDQAGNWRESDDCKADINVFEAPKVLSAESSQSLPETGTPIKGILLLLSMGLLGGYLYKRFKLL